MIQNNKLFCIKPEPCYAMSVHFFHTDFYKPQLVADNFFPLFNSQKTCHKIYSTTLWNCNKFLKVYSNPQNGKYMVLEKQVCQSVNWNTISVLLSWYSMHMYFEHAYYILFTFV